MRQWYNAALLWLVCAGSALAQAPAAMPQAMPPAAQVAPPSLPPAVVPPAPAVAAAPSAAPTAATTPIAPPSPGAPVPAAPPPALGTTPAMPLPAPAGAMAPPPGQVPVQQIGAPAAPAPAAAPAAPAKAPPRYKSVMFSEPDMGKIYSSAQTYRISLAKAKEMAKKVGQPVTPDLIAKAQNATLPAAPQPEKARSVDHPQFYLAFIGYDGDNNWTLWMNKHKYTSAAPKFGDVEVVSVNQTSARFSWRPKMFPVYEDRIPAGTNASRISVIKAEERIEFTLFSNQSFSAFSMTVEEGYMPPVRVEQFTTAISVTDTDTTKPATTTPLPAPR